MASETHPAPPLERTMDGEDGYDCPECGGVLVDLHGGDGSGPVVGEMCVRCDFTHYDGDPWPGTEDDDGN